MPWRSYRHDPRVPRDHPDPGGRAGRCRRRDPDAGRGTRLPISTGLSSTSAPRTHRYGGASTTSRPPRRRPGALLLHRGGGPLIIDQPEDDLDNRFITEGVVPKMREEKRRRQFIFSTHNANIPVLGDVDQIVP